MHAVIWLTDMRNIYSIQLTHQKYNSCMQDRAVNLAV